MNDTDRRRHLRRAILTVVTTALAITGAVATMYAQDDLTMLEDTVEGPYALAATLHVADPQALSVLVVIDRQDSGDGYALRLSPARVAIERIVDGTATEIGRARGYGGFEAESDLEMTVRRDGWGIELILNHEVLARAYDATLSGGQVGYSVQGGEIADPMLQPLGGVYMTDDFMRAADARSTWEPVQGTWKTQSLRVDEQSDRMEADKSANAFSYWGKAGDGPAITCSGYWFWDNYSVSAAVRPADTDPLGLVVYFQDTENYILARWTSALSTEDNADRLQLLSVVGGVRSLLGEVPGGHLPGQWYRIELRICDGLMQCLVDDARPTCSARGSRACTARAPPGPSSTASPSRIGRSWPRTSKNRRPASGSSTPGAGASTAATCGAAAPATAWW